MRKHKQNAEIGKRAERWKLVRIVLTVAMALVVVSAWAAPVSGASKSVESDISVGGNLYPTPPKPPEEPGPEEPTPEEPTPEEPTPEEPTPEKPTPEDPTPGKPTPDNPTPNNPTPTPDNPTPTPDNPAPYTPPATPNGASGGTPANSAGASTTSPSTSTGAAANATSTSAPSATRAADGGGAAAGAGSTGNETAAPDTVADADTGAAATDVIGSGTDATPLSTENPEQVPLVQASGAGYALVNLLAAGFGAALFICARIHAAKTRRRSNPRSKDKKSSTASALPGLIAAAAGVALCVLTQDVTGSMAMMDAYTPLQIAILAVVIGAFCLVDLKRTGADRSQKRRVDDVA
jgi:outer membrane biosynthesis protein TonB